MVKASEVVGVYPTHISPDKSVAKNPVYPVYPC